MLWLIVFIPFVVQAIAMLVDEGYFHIRRGLPRWERLGHPLDTLSVLACLCFVIFVPYSGAVLKWYIGLAVLSCLMITKDEFVHKHHCPSSEQWLHALLFINHPILLTAVGILWPIAQGALVPSWLFPWTLHQEQLRFFLMMQMLSVSAFFLYQAVYWNLLRSRKA